MNYDRINFLDFFDVERVIDQQTKDYEYNIKIGEFLFKIHIMVYDEFASITLYHQAYEQYIFNIGFEDIVEIKIKSDQGKEFLQFYKQQEDFLYKDQEIIEPFIQVQIKPIPSITLQIN